MTVNHGILTGWQWLSLAAFLIIIGLLLYCMQTRRRLRAIEHTQATPLSTATTLPLLSRSDFIAALEATLAQPSAVASHRIGLFYIDLDNFRMINESFGHRFGDTLLSLVGERLHTELAGQSGFAGSMNADEFAFCLTWSEASNRTLDHIAETICQAVHAPFVFTDKEISLNCSIGICTYPDNADSAETLLKRVDKARYDAKRLGRSQHILFSTVTQDVNTEKRPVLLQQLRRALEQDEFYLVYQPKIKLMTNQIVGAEALIRWESPELGRVPPSEFIPLAEQVGFINPIGDWVIARACKDLAFLQSQGLSQLQLAVNISANQFNTGDVAGVIANHIWELKLHSHNLELELTEGVLMNNPERSALMLRVLKSMGVGLAIDDFGTGYSSFALLKTLPIDTLKIDQAFVKDLHQTPDNQAIVAAMISMSRQLGLSTVAEGVTVQAEIDILKAQQCDILQGYYFSEPLRIDALQAFVQAYGKTQ